MERRPIDIDDLLRIRFPHDAAIAPDGSRVVYAVARLDYDANEFRGQLWMVPTPGGRPAPFTTDEARDAEPVWSPDGRWIAFLSNRGGRRRGRKKAATQIWVMPADGGEARQLTFFKAGASQPAWSPDGTSLVFVSRGTPDALETAPDGDEPPIVREINRPKYRFDGQGYLDGYAHVWMVPVEGGDPVVLTDGDFDHESPAWLPGTHEVVVVANRTSDADFSFTRDLWAIDVRTRAMRKLTYNSGPCHSPVPSPGGDQVAFVGHDFHAKTATNFGVWVVPAAGGQATNLTAGFDRSVGNAVGSDARLAPMFVPPVWTPDGGALIFLATDSGRTHLYRVGVADRTVRPLTEGDEVVADLTAAAGTIVYQRMSPARLDELWVLALGGQPRRLVAVNDELLEGLAIREPRHFTYTGVDGWSLDGWYLTPPDFTPTRPYPAILRIHGGPHAAYGALFSHYVHLLADRGYVVVWTNPRGSGGYGEAFTRAVVGDWGGKDSRDILLGLDHVIAQGFIDSGRVAVTGGSYGGFMTNWLITHTTRFRCAVSEVCVSNLHSFYGTSDIGATWGELEWGANPWDDPERLLMQSPLSYVRNVSTPVLLVANEADHRCPVEQTEQFYMALRKWGKDVVFLRFRDESHTMQSNGRPKPRIERLRRLTAWFDRHLQPVGEPAAAARA
jgi:dipeptidyl aminopeptidase/acylaminoacyl peptidase